MVQPSANGAALTGWRTPLLAGYPQSRLLGQYGVIWQPGWCVTGLLVIDIQSFPLYRGVTLLHYSGHTTQRSQEPALNLTRLLLIDDGASFPH